MDKSIRIFTSFDAMKDEEYKEWRNMQPYERLDAAFELSTARYGKRQVKTASRALKKDPIRALRSRIQKAGKRPL